MNVLSEFSILTPGKLVLMGEYAVIEGAPAVAMAVNRHVVVRAGPSATGGLVALAREETVRRLGVTLGGEEFVADSAALGHGTLKLGLGSSAAVTAGAVASVFHQACLDVEDALVRTRMWDIAHAVHNEFQGSKGSGIDIAASLFGGRVVMRRPCPEAPPAFGKWLPPSGVRWVYLWTGCEASTPALLGAIRKFKDQDPREYARIVTAMNDMVERFLGEGSSQADLMLDCMHQYALLMERLGRASGAAIMDQRMNRCLAMAKQAGGAAKPSGAGGGDFIVAAFPADCDVAGFVRDVREADMSVFDLGVAERGTHVA